MKTLDIENISLSFGNNRLLNGINFQVNTGEIQSIFGRNGCGKSTLLKTLFGTQKVDVFSVVINEKPVYQKEIISSQRIGYLPQESFLPKNKKVRDIIPMYFDNSEAQDRVFNAPNIYRIANTSAGKLSLGELRYFELLLVANLNHSFLLLDEPFSMVEPLYKEKIKEFLQELKHKKGIIVTDHYYRDVLDVSTKNAVLKNGKLININTPDDLLVHGYLKNI